MPSSLIDTVAQEKRNSGYSRMITRKWNEGDVYAPHDMSGAEMRKGRRSRRMPDLVDRYKIRPLDMYKVSFSGFFLRGGGGETDVITYSDKRLITWRQTKRTPISLPTL